jgi:hypothetical protein
MRKKRDRVSKKISILRHEDVPQKQAVAMALSMNRAGRLTPEGGYKRVGRKRVAKNRQTKRSE